MRKPGTEEVRVDVRRSHIGAASLVGSASGWAGSGPPTLTRITRGEVGSPKGRPIGRPVRATKGTAAGRASTQGVAKAILGGRGQSLPQLLPPGEQIGMILEGILHDSADLQVSRVGTAPVFALMMENQTLRNCPDDGFIYHSMDVRLLLVDGRSPVSIDITAERPHQATAAVRGEPGENLIDGNRRAAGPSSDRQAMATFEVQLELPLTSPTHLPTTRSDIQITAGHFMPTGTGPRHR